MNEFDDPVLRDRLARYAGPTPDAPAAYAGFQVRVRQAKRRRAAVWCGSAAAAAIGIGALVSFDRGDSSAIRPASDSSITLMTPATTASTSTTVAETTAEAQDTAPAPTTAQDLAIDTTAALTDGAPSGAPPAAPAPAAPATGDNPAQAPAVDPGLSQSSTGGTITVDVIDGHLVLVAATPNPGYETQVEDGRSDRVRVWFTNGSARSRITARLASDGSVGFSVVERGAGGDHGDDNDDDDDGGWRGDDDRNDHNGGGNDGRGGRGDDDRGGRGDGDRDGSGRQGRGRDRSGG